VADADAPTLTPLQLSILGVLWDRGQASSADVRSALAPERSLALTTVTTLLSRLERKGVLNHTRSGRRYLYHATVSRREVRRAMVDELLGCLFDGEPVALFAYLLNEGRIRPAEVRHLLESR